MSTETWTLIAFRFDFIPETYCILIYRVYSLGSFSSDAYDNAYELKIFAHKHCISTNAIAIRFNAIFEIEICSSTISMSSSSWLTMATQY